MKQVIVTIALLFIVGSACNKDDIDSTLSVEVVDYITEKPIEGAIVKRSYSNNFSFYCLCYQVNAIDSLGITDQNGKLHGLLDLSFIFVEKDEYYTASEYHYGIHEKSEYLLKFYLFKQSGLAVIQNSSKVYWPEPYIKVGPILKDGSMFTLNDNRNGLPSIIGHVSQQQAAGDMVNRLLVLKTDEGRNKVDTLFKKEIFIPANTKQKVIVDY